MRNSKEIWGELQSIYKEHLTKEGTPVIVNEEDFNIIVNETAYKNNWSKELYTAVQLSGVTYYNETRISKVGGTKIIK